MTWTPHVTVATIVEDAGRFLVVEELKQGRKLINQPAGHLEAGETLIEAAQRETLEETGWTVSIDGVVGMALYHAPNDVTYHRTTFFGRAHSHDPERVLDEGILGAHWMTLDELRNEQERLRSPLVLRVIEQYLQGHRHPLSMILN